MSASARKDSLRVVHVDTGTTWRGGQRQVLLLAHGLAEAGHASILVCPPGGRLCSRGAESGLPTVPVDASSDIDVAAALQVRRAINAQRADIVHAHDARAHALCLVALVGLRTPLVVTRRVTFAPKGRVKYGPRVARFIAISRAVRDSLMAAGVPEDRVTVVYSGVDAPATAHRVDWRARLGLSAETIVCGLVGAMTAEKGVHALDAIMAAIPAGVAGRLALVMIGGAGPPRAESIGPVPVFHAGFINDIAGALAGVDMIWHPSSSEGLGTALLDAMHQGVPPVAYAVGGIPEMVEHEASGLLVEPGDETAFAAAVARLATDSALHDKLSKGAIGRARRFSASGMIAGTLSVYEEVLNDR